MNLRRKMEEMSEKDGDLKRKRIYTYLLAVSDLNNVCQKEINKKSIVV